MEGKVTISLDDFNKLKDAEKAFLKIHEHTDGITLQRFDDCIGSYYKVFSKDEGIALLDAKLTSNIIELHSLKSKCSKLKEEEENLKTIIKILKAKLKPIRDTKPWYKQIFKK